MSEFTSSNSTKRVVNAELEKILLEKYNVLDHGFIRIIDYMGDDSSIVQAARVSYGKGTKTINQDKGLINYLMRHFHTTPFEMCEIKFHIKLPIFVARQWIRHRMSSVNEYSARYSILSKEFYLPQQQHVKKQSVSNKQGGGDALAPHEAQRVIDVIKQDSLSAYSHYLEMLGVEKDYEDATGNDQNSPQPDNVKPVRDGVARELARMNLSLNYYTEWYWKIDLHNLLHFLRLRADGHAQFEIREYAQKMLEMVKVWVPYTYEAFMNYRMDSYNLSAKSIEFLREVLKSHNVSPDQTTSSLSRGELEELKKVLF